MFIMITIKIEDRDAKANLYIFHIKNSDKKNAAGVHSDPSSHDAGQSNQKRTNVAKIVIDIDEDEKSRLHYSVGILEKRTKTPQNFKVLLESVVPESKNSGSNLMSPDTYFEILGKKIFKRENDADLAGKGILQVRPEILSKKPQKSDKVDSNRHFANGRAKFKKLKNGSFGVTEASHDSDRAAIGYCSPTFLGLSSEKSHQI